MAEKRKLKKKGQEVPVQVEVQPTKIEYAVANYLRNNVPTKKTKFLSHQVSYFNANKAIDVLLDSSWASGENALFTDRASVVEFGNKLLQHKFFHRAKKIAVTDKDLSPKELKKRKEKEKEKEKEKKKKKEESEDSKKEEEKTQDEGEKTKLKVKEKELKKKKTKIKLDMHLDQIFVDGPEAYVWMYDPIPFWYYIAGALLLFAAVAVCLFPLWPPVVRKGVYYVSIGAAGFLAVILGLAVLRFIIFTLIWTLSLGRHHFWILPNLTEDVGFFASFWPLYHYEYKGTLSDEKKKSKKKKEDSDDKSSKESREKKVEVEDIDSQSALDTDKPETDADGERTQDPDGSMIEETDSENSNSNSQTFEMLSKDELSSEDVKKE